MSAVKQSRTRAVGRAVVSTVALAAVFLVAVAAGVVAHLDVPAGRRLVAAGVNAALARSLAGEVRVERIGRLGVFGTEGVAVRVRDPEGIQVLEADGVFARVDTLRLARSALFERGPIEIVVHAAGVDHVRVSLDADQGGELRLSRAVRGKSAESERQESEPGRGVIVDAPDLRLAHAWAHGAPPGAVPLDAEAFDLAARVLVAPTGIRAELARVRVLSRGLPRGLDPKGALAGRVWLDPEGRSETSIEASFEGAIGGIPTSADARLAGKELVARLDARDEAGASAQAMLAEGARRERMSLHAEARGRLPEIEASALLSYGAASLQARVTVDTSAPMRVEGSAAGREIDLAALAEGAPDSALAFDARADVSLREDGPYGTVELDLHGGRVDAEPTPPVEARARLDGDALKARARVRDASMPAELSLDVAERPNGEGRQIDAEVWARVPDLRRVPMLDAVGGAARISASGRLLLPERRIDASARVALADLVQSPRSVRRAEVRARARGTLERAEIDATMSAKGVVTGAARLESVEARADLALSPASVEVRRARLRAVPSGGPPISARADRIEAHAGAVRVEGVEVTGLGGPIRLEGMRRGRELRAKVDASRVDLGRAARLVGLDDVIQSGALDLSGEARLARGELTADVHADVRGLDARRVTDAHATVDLAVKGRDVTFAARGRLDGAGSFSVQTEDLALGAPLDHPDAWRRARGHVDVQAVIDMDRAASLLPAGALPVADLRGLLTVQGRLGREDASAPPDIRFHAHTNGLLVAGPWREDPPPVDGVVVTHAPRWRSTDLDVGLDLRTDAASGFTSFALRATDPHGAVVALDAKAILPYRELLARGMTDALLRAPLSAVIEVPSRRADRLPRVLGVGEVEGELAGRLEASGTVLEPKVRLSASARGVRLPAMPPRMAADVDLSADYDGARGAVAVQVTDRGRELLYARSDLRARVEDALSRGAAMPWTASARARLAAFPLESVPALADRSVAGEVTGEVSLEGLRADARADAHFDFKGLRIGRARYESGTVSARAADGELAARVRLDQEDGRLDARAETGLTWGSALAPALDDTRPSSASLFAHAFRAAAIQPFVQEALPSVDGRIDADVSLELAPGRSRPTMKGYLKLREGTVQVAALGEELRDVRASVTLTPDGQVRVEDVAARGGHGELAADATAKLDGLELAEAIANVRIPDRKPLDVSVGGQPLGQVSGVVRVRASPSLEEGAMALAVDVPKLKVALSQVTKKGVQPLETRDDIRVGVYRDARTFVQLPRDRRDTLTSGEQADADLPRAVVQVHLGDIEVDRGTMARVKITGDPKIVVGRESRIFGQISATGGFIDVQGKRFEVEKGTVTFEGESPPNPVVVATAGWTAADNTRVYADFVGPVKTGKVEFRSEPARPKNELLALVLFGTASGANPTPPPPGRQPDGATKAAVGLGGGFAAEGLTEALDDLAGIQTTARIDTTHSNNPRPELEIQVGPKVTLRFAHVIGTPPVTEPDKNLATVDYRFHEHWSLETTVGDHGKATVDAIWQKRY